MTASEKIEASLAGEASQVENNDEFRIEDTSTSDFSKADFQEKSQGNTSEKTFQNARDRSNKIQDEYTKKEGPLPLQREPIPPKPFPFEALGSMLGSAARRTFELIKAPDSICGQSFLSAAALITQSYANIHIDGRRHPLSLFAITVGESGDRKSAVDNIALKAVREYQERLTESYPRERKAYKNKLEVWRKKRAELIGNTDISGLEGCLNDLEAEPIPPLEPYVLVEEPTYEGLLKLFAVGRPGLGLFSDDGGHMLGGYSMGKDRILNTITGLSCLWDGNKPITRIRGGDERLILYGRRLSLHLMVQEVVFSGLLQNELLIGQGLLARCLIVAPPTNSGNRPYEAKDYSKESSLISFWNRTAVLIDQSMPLANGDMPNILSPRSIELDKAAKARWIAFHDQLDHEMRPEGLYRAIRRTTNKAAEQVLRIAGVLTMIDNLEAGSISLETLERAIILVQFYLDEALRINEMGFDDPDLKLATALLNWMKKKANEKPDKIFNLQEIYQRGGPSGVRTRDAALKVMGILEKHQLVKRPKTSENAWSLM